MNDLLNYCVECSRPLYPREEDEYGNRCVVCIDKADAEEASRLEFLQKRFPKGAQAELEKHRGEEFPPEIEP
jgi:hypothetical protein